MVCFTNSGYTYGYFFLFFWLTTAEELKIQGFHFEASHRPWVVKRHKCLLSTVGSILFPYTPRRVDVSWSSASCCWGQILWSLVCRSFCVNVNSHFSRINAEGEIAGLYGRSDFHFKRNSQTNFQSGYTILHSFQQGMSDSFSVCSPVFGGVSYSFW